ncbi:MAG: polyhydroxybutyrate depolymerase [Alphaproteobacteria bacterium]|nr:polyhydroxybutyrate depolymerase [Alphaproteobacteria bacterium]MDE2163600.1 polyhydroxybutyrate depolymerase [Alphaproteobacteria bacterium]
MGWKILALGLLAAWTVCAQAADTRSFEFDGRARSYIVFRPPNLARSHAVPLVVMLHGGFGSGSQAEEAYKWDEEADRQGFVVVYPDGIRRSWNAGGNCCGKAHRDDVDDVGFLTKLIETVVHTENIDAKRVYLTGMSNGAAMSYRYGCEGSFPIAAIGAVSGSLSYPCAGAHAVSVMEIHGLDDTRIPFAGGHGNGAASDVAWLGVEKTLDLFRKADACGTLATEESGVVRKAVSRCAQGREVALITVKGAGHQWPGSNKARGLVTWLLRLDPPSTALDATPVLWRFFAAHAAD